MRQPSRACWQQHYPNSKGRSAYAFKGPASLASKLKCRDLPESSRQRHIEMAARQTTATVLRFAEISIQSTIDINRPATLGLEGKIPVRSAVRRSAGGAASDLHRTHRDSISRARVRPTRITSITSR
jgi:hypothetical protein